MNRMMIFGMFASTFLLGSLSADEAQPPAATETVTASPSCVNLGLGPFPIAGPVFGTVGKLQKGYQWMDVPAKITTTGSSFDAARESVSYVLIPLSKISSKFYVGNDLGIAEIFIRHHVNRLLSSHAINGKKYVNELGDRRFFEGQNDWPLLKVTYYMGDEVNYPPIVVISYNFCF
jgi:hypothetical protein